ncbi:dienelactone hydrolase [Penicillium cf. viridicatum]|uniref:Dienelactone hydrolase n=1 Tax=Penicillium cf. viridicatum TaxID=2972119 RepID=A0A9W9MBW5_9EURO|nr:dienelactone hydrolase [Penicillium cf. viridicatum]
MVDSVKPPVVDVVIKDYTPQGREETIAGLRTYVVGPTNAEVGVVIAYDVMGLSCNTKQGADIVSRALNAIVFIPDLLQGVYADPAWLPPDTEEKREKFFGYLKGYAAPPKYVETLIEVTNEYKASFPGVVALASKKNTPFTASVQLHPGMLDPADAKEINIPHMVLASKDEPAEPVAGFKTVIEDRLGAIGGFVETYTKMFHGWMGTNAKLDQEESRNGYIRGYTQVIDFLRG